MVSHSTPSKVVLLASGALVLSGLLQLGTAWVQFLSRTPTDPANRTHTWIADDYPNALQLDLGEPVALTLEDSPHYSLDSPDADAEWQSIYPGSSDGFVRLGPNHRLFGVAVYHQIHCLDSLRFAVLGRHHASRAGPGARRHESERDVPHAQHCLNYLRQTILCSADLTLEPEVVLGSQDVGEGLGATHVCRDWSKVHAFVENNDKEYRSGGRNMTGHK